MPRLNFSRRNVEVGMALAGKSYTEIGKCFGCCTETITNLMDKYRNYGTVAFLPGKGRKKVAQRTRRLIIRYHTIDPYRTTTESGNQYGYHRTTVAKILKKLY